MPVSHYAQWTDGHLRDRREEREQGTGCRVHRGCGRRWGHWGPGLVTWPSGDGSKGTLAAWLCGCAWGTRGAVSGGGAHTHTYTHTLTPVSLRKGF